MKYAPNDTSLCSGRHAEVRDVTRSLRPVTAAPSRCTGLCTTAPGAAGTVASASPVALVHVERADAHGVAGAGQEHPLKQGRHAQSSTVSEPARALPAVKYGAIRLSNIVSADPIAMCMSRYL